MEMYEYRLPRYFREVDNTIDKDNCDPFWKESSRDLLYCLCCYYELSHKEECSRDKLAELVRSFSQKFSEIIEECKKNNYPCLSKLQSLAAYPRPVLVSVVASSCGFLCDPFEKCA